MEICNCQLENVFSRYEGTRSELVPILQDAQTSLGYLPLEALKAIAGFLVIPESQVYGVATFYEQFYFSRRGENEIKVCYGTACHVKGATRLIESFEHQLGIDCGSTTDDYKYSLERVACVGSCALAPLVVINGKVHAQMEPAQVKNLISEADQE